MAEGDLTREEAMALIGPPEPILPATNDIAGLLRLQDVQQNVPPIVGDTRRRQQMLGEELGVPFHEEGLNTWENILAKSVENQERQLQFLAKRFGPENVRLNEFQEPVVRITNPETGQPEDYPLNPRKLTMNSLYGLARFAPDLAGSLLAAGMGAKRGAGLLRTAIVSALGGETGAAGRELGVLGTELPIAQLPVRETVSEKMGQVPADLLADLGLAGLVKGGQVVKGLGLPKIVGGGGINIPNPLASTSLLQPARPEFTREGVEAGLRLGAISGIDPQFRISETTGIPMWAMLEQYMERKPAGAAPQIAAGAERERASKAIQSWMIDPATLPMDEQIGRRGLAAIKQTIAPLEQNVEAAQAAALKGITAGMKVSDIPKGGVFLGPVGDTFKSGAMTRREAFWTESDKRYEAFFAHPLSIDPVIPGSILKGPIDDMLKDLPKVRKIGPKGPIDIPITTPIRPRLEELSSKLDQGMVSLNDFKQIRTDIGQAIKIGEAIPGVKEGRLKHMYGLLTKAIDDGLAQINDPNLTQLWKDATSFYASRVDRFTEKNVAKLFREAEQTSAVGDRAFALKLITDEDAYKAARNFFGSKSSELSSLKSATRQKLLSDSMGGDQLVDPQNLVRQLKSLKDNNPELFRDAFANQGNEFLKAASFASELTGKIPVDEIDKLMKAIPTGPYPVTKMQLKLIELGDAQKKLNQQYQNEVVRKFLGGSVPADQLQPDRFVASITQAKLSDVQDVMARLRQQDPQIAEQVSRKTIQNLLSEARRSATPTDTMAKLQGEPGDLISAVGLHNAIGKGDQQEKYKAILGPLFDHLIDFTKMELLGEERRNVARNVGMLAPGNAMNQLVKALTPWEGQNKGKGLVLELSGLARDKIVSIALSNQAIRNWLVSPYALKNAYGAIRNVIISQPFIEGVMEEFQDADTVAHVMSTLKSSFGTATQELPAAQAGALSREQAEQLVPRP